MLVSTQDLQGCDIYTPYFFLFFVDGLNTLLWGMTLYFKIKYKRKKRERETSEIIKKKKGKKRNIRVTFWVLFHKKSKK